MNGRASNVMGDLGPELILPVQRQAIEGAKGGGGQRTPVQAPDSLRSISYFRILDLVSEGEIGGLVNGLQSVYLNDTPLANADGSLNFQNAHVETRTGTQDQDYIPGYAAVENEVAVGVELKSAAPWMATITDTQLSAVRITLGVPQLQSTNTSNGDINGYTVAYHIDVQTDGGAWQTALTGSFSGKTTSKYQRSHRVDLPAATQGWNVRVVRTTANANSATVADVTTVDSYTQIIDAKLRYPNSAMVAVSGDAQAFQNIPTRSYDMWGRVIRVPSNYDPLARTYASVWDGSFKMAWSNNPAWVFLDLISHPRYGLGDRISAAQVDKWALYAIARYCDESVPDGNGGTEPRFTCNVFLQTASDAYKLLGDLASLFRGLAYWNGVTITATADMPADPAYLYTGANVIDGKFTYASSQRTARYTTALVTWNNPANAYAAEVEYVQHDAGLRRYGIQPMDMVAFGCTSRGQAQRAGQWALQTSQQETETVTFGVGKDGMLAAPGQIIRVQDPARAGKRQGGRIHSATTTVVTVDHAPDAVAVGDKLTCTLPSGTTETHTITAMDGVTLTVAAPGFSVAPLADASWLAESATLVAQQFRVISVAELKSEGQVGYTITAVQNAPGKYGSIDTGATAPQLPISALPMAVQAPPTDVMVTSAQVVVQGASQPVVTITWKPAAGAESYRVEWQRNSGGWISAGTTNGQSIDVYGAYTGSYVARVYAVSPSGVVSLPASSDATAVTGKTQPPDPPTLTATGGQLQIVLNWTWPAGVNVEDTSYTEVWVSPTSTMADGASAGGVAYAGTSYTISGLLPQQQRYAWVRLVDKSGNVGPWSTPANAVGGTAADLFKPLQDQITTTQGNVDAAVAQVQVLQGQVGDILQADVWVSTKTYPNGDLVQYAGKLYRSLVDGNVGHEPSGATDANWEYIGNYASLGEAVGANAANIATVQNTVTQQGDTITANSQSISQNAAAIGTKADASALNATNATVTAQGNSITAVAQDVSLLGAHNAGKTAFVLNQGTVQVDGTGTTLGQYITGVQAANTAVNARVDSEQTARANGDAANSSAITAVTSSTIAPAINYCANPNGDNGSLTGWGKATGSATMASGAWTSGALITIGGGTDGTDSVFYYSVTNTAAQYSPWCAGAEISVGNLTAGSYFYLAFAFFNAAGSQIGGAVAANVNANTVVSRINYYVGGSPPPAGTTRIDFRLVLHGSVVAGSNISIRGVKIEASAKPTAFSQDSTVSANASAISTLNTTVSNQDGRITANANAITAVTVRMPGGTGTVATAADVTAVQNQVNASWTLMLDVNGHVSGVKAQNTGTVSNLVIVADNFSILPSSGTGLRTEYSAGNWRVYDAAGTLRVRMGVW